MPAPARAPRVSCRSFHRVTRLRCLLAKRFVPGGPEIPRPITLLNVGRMGLLQRPLTRRLHHGLRDQRRPTNAGYESPIAASFGSHPKTPIPAPFTVAATSKRRIVPQIQAPHRRLSIPTSMAHSSTIRLASRAKSHMHHSCCATTSRYAPEAASPRLTCSQIQSTASQRADSIHMAFKASE